MRCPYTTNITVGSYWTYEEGTTMPRPVYQVTEKYPSIGGATYERFRLKHLRSEEEYVCNYNEMEAYRLKQMDPEDVPMALLGDA